MHTCFFVISENLTENRPLSDHVLENLTLDGAENPLKISLFQRGHSVLCQIIIQSSFSDREPSPVRLRPLSDCLEILSNNRESLFLSIVLSIIIEVYSP